MDGTLSNMSIGPHADRASPERKSAAGAAGLGLALALVYLANGSGPIGADDTEPATYLPLALVRGDGPFLDRFAPLYFEGQGKLPWYVTQARGHVVSRYPVAPALVAVPLVWPQVVLLDRVRPGWDRDLHQARWYCQRMTKVASALIAALTGVALYVLLVRAGLGQVALASVLAASLGSELWMIGSQSLWQHGPAALALTLAISLLLPRPLTRTRVLLAGLAASLMVASRAIDIVFAAAMVGYLACRDRRALAWFLVFPLLGASALLCWNYWYFGTLSGGQAQLEALHSELHGAAGSWTGNLAEGAAGTLFSPGRGLFIFSPWVLVALLGIPRIKGRPSEWSLLGWFVLALVPFLAIVSKYAVWWAGHCFGPRFWTETTPIFAMLLALTLDEARGRNRLVLAGAKVAIAISVAVQCLGACNYPSSWNDRPGDVDRHPERIWSWRDQELTRGIEESPLDPSARVRSAAQRVCALAARARKAAVPAHAHGRQPVASRTPALLEIKP